MSINKSPERNTFQLNNYIERCKEEGTEPSEDYLNFWKSASQEDDENMVNPEWQKDNMEYDLRSAKWICDKAKESNGYAQNLYAAMCNRDFIQAEVMPILKNQRWSCSWRHAGGIVADMREEGDYIDWYCSGMGGLNVGTQDEDDYKRLELKYVPESAVTDEIRADLRKLGWIVLDDQSDE
jgi:hypothetical protein